MTTGPSIPARPPGSERLRADLISIGRAAEAGVERILGYRQVSDAHLLTLAIRRGGRLATFDGGIRELLGDASDPDEVVELIR